MIPEAREETINKIRTSLNVVCTPDGMVTKDIAKKFVRNSARWLTHIHGPVQAPGHSDRIYGSEKNWCVTFGANTFLISKALSRCRNTIEEFIDQSTPENPGSFNELKIKLKRDIRRSVSNHRGDEYVIYGLIHESDMVFGAQSINVSDFILTLFEIVPVLDLFFDKRTSSRFFDRIAGPGI